MKAQCRLGYLYENGIGTLKNSSIAFKYFTQALMQGSKTASTILQEQLHNAIRIVNSKITGETESIRFTHDKSGAKITLLLGMEELLNRTTHLTKQQYDILLALSLELYNIKRHPINLFKPDSVSEFQKELKKIGVSKPAIKFTLTPKDIQGLLDTKNSSVSDNLLQLMSCKEAEIYSKPVNNPTTGG